jgi:aminoglycoside phosphotransferase (APT) family kinase protein
MANRSVTPSLEDFRKVVAPFSLPGILLDGERYGSGHINDTFVANYDQAGTRVRYILQRVNHHIFKNVPELMENIIRVTSHVESKNSANDSRRALTLRKTVDGLPYHQTPEGDFWRVYLFVEGARTYDAVEHPRQAYEAARAFGLFQQALADLPGGRLHETIPHFHDTPKRFENLRKAAEEDVAGRKHEVLAELEFAFKREPEVSRLLDLVAKGEIPERVTHNDTKLNNVMLDDKTGEGICVIDLDTVMPGLSLYDFGDLVRFGTNTAAEDETDPAKIDVSLPVFEAIVEGYVAGAGNILTDAEWDNRVFAGTLMTYEVGIRFLTDYLQGDIYFKIKHPGHNLERARNQLRLVDRIEAADEALQAIVRKYRAAR